MTSAEPILAHVAVQDRTNGANIRLAATVHHYLTGILNSRGPPEGVALHWSSRNGCLQYRYQCSLSGVGSMLLLPFMLTTVCNSVMMSSITCIDMARIHRVGGAAEGETGPQKRLPF